MQGKKYVEIHAGSKQGGHHADALVAAAVMMASEVSREQHAGCATRRIRRVARHVLHQHGHRAKGFGVSGEPAPWPHGDRPLNWNAALPPYRYVEVPRFEAGDPESRAYLAEQGFVVRHLLSTAPRPPHHPC